MSPLIEVMNTTDTEPRTCVVTAVLSEIVVVGSGFLGFFKDGETEELHAEGVAPGATGLPGDEVSIGAAEVDKGHGFLVEAEEVECLASFARLQVGQGDDDPVAMERVEGALEVCRRRAVVGVVGVLFEEFMGSEGELGGYVAFDEGELEYFVIVPGERPGPGCW